MFFLIHVHHLPPPSHYHAFGGRPNHDDSVHVDARTTHCDPTDLFSNVLMVWLTNSLRWFRCVEEISCNDRVSKYAHPRWPPQHWNIYKRCSTTFICCGCAYEWVLTTLRLLTLGKFFGSNQIFHFRFPTGFKLQHCEVIEAIDPSERAPPHQCQTYKRCFTTIICCGFAYYMNESLPSYGYSRQPCCFVTYSKLWIPLGGQTQHYIIGEAISPFKMAPISMVNI